MLRNATLSRQAQQQHPFYEEDSTSSSSHLPTRTPPNTTGLAPSHPHPIPRIPSIRLISATPSATGLSSSEASSSVTSFSKQLEESWDESAAKARAGPAPPVPVMGRKVSASLLPKDIAEETPRRKLVPKKSKLGMGISASSFGARDKSQDFSDVIRRVGATAADKGTRSALGKAGSASLRGGFEIYVDPTVDPEIGEIVMVKKKKSRAGLDGMRWGGNGNAGGAPVLGEVTNVPKTAQEGVENVPAKKDGLLKVKENEKDTMKWWSIGRGRKDSKEDKEKKKAMKPVEFIYEPPTSNPPRSKTPDLLSFTRPKLSKGPSTTDSASSSNKDSLSRGRFNSLDSGILLGLGSNTSSKARNGKSSSPPLGTSTSNTPFSDSPASTIAFRSATPTLHFSSEVDRDRAASPVLRVNSPVEHVSISQYPFAGMRSATPTPTMNGLLAPPSVHLQVPTGAGGKDKENAQGSIALRAIRSVRSLARIGNWQVKEDEEETKEDGVKEKKEKEKEKEKKSLRTKKYKTVKSKDGSEIVEEGQDEKKDGTVKVKKTKSSKSSKSTKSTKKENASAEADAGSLKGTLKRKVKKSLSKKDLKSLLPTSSSNALSSAPDSRASTSSFEIGHLTASPSPVKHKVKEHDGDTKSNTLGVKKRSILGLSMGLGLGLPSTMRLPTMRSGSTASSIFGSSSANVSPANSTSTPGAALNAPEPNRLSVDSALALGRGRSGSVASTGSSLRPISTHSTGSGVSSQLSHPHSGSASVYSTSSNLNPRRNSNASGVGSVIANSNGGGSSIISNGSVGVGGRNSGASIRWSSEVLERERKEERRTSRESKHSVEGRRRGAIVSVFPELGEGEDAEDVVRENIEEEDVVEEIKERDEKRNSASSSVSANSNARSSMSSAFARRAGYPILTIEEATCDGHQQPFHLSSDVANGEEEWRKVAMLKLEKEREAAMRMLSQRATYGSVRAQRLSGSSMASGSERGGELERIGSMMISDAGDVTMSAEGDEDEDEETGEVVATPAKKARTRPMSEQLLGKIRPKGMHEDEEGVLSILDAATNDLALLINVLDLQATPSTPGDLTPYKPSAPPSPLSSLERKRIEAKISMEGMNSSLTSGTASNRTSGVPSPLSKTLRGSMGSVSSLRPYAQSRGGATRTATTPLLSHMGSLASLNAGLERMESIASLRGKLRPAVSRGALNAMSSTTTLKQKTSAEFGAETVRLRPAKAAPAPVSNANAAASLIARPIKPWSDLLQTISPQKPTSRTSTTSTGTASTTASTSFSPASLSSSTGTFRRGHKRTMTPAPEPEPAPVFQPLRPATRTRKALPFGLQPSLMEKEPTTTTTAAAEGQGEEDAFGQITHPGFTIGLGSISKASTHTAVSRGSKGSTASRASKGSDDGFALNFASGGGGSLTPVFKRIFEDEKERERKASAGASSFLSVDRSFDGRTAKRGSVGSYMSASELTRSVHIHSASTISAPEASFGSPSPRHLDVSTSSHPTEFEITLPLNASARRVLGMSGTLGGSTGSVYHSDGTSSNSNSNSNSSEDDEDSDVPEELKFILRGERKEKTKTRVSMAQSIDFRNSLVSESDTQLEVDDTTHDIELGRREIDELTQALNSPPPDLLLPNFQFTLSHSTSSHSLHRNLNLDLDLCASPASSVNDEDTKKSFDFTGELKKLNESGASDRRSFVEQLENAFRTPAKVDLRAAFGGEMLRVEVPPVPELPEGLRKLGESFSLERSVESSMDKNMMSEEGEGDVTFEMEGVSMEESVESEAMRVPVVLKEIEKGMPQDKEQESESLVLRMEESDSQLVDMLQPSLMNKTSFIKSTTSVEQKDGLTKSQSASQSASQFDMFSTSQLIDAKEPTFDSLMDSDDLTGQIIVSDNSSDKARLSPGELNTSFKFGGLPPSLSGSTSSLPKEGKNVDGGDKPLTLSDIIPSPAHARKISEYSNSMDEEDSILKSIYAQIMAVPRPQYLVPKDNNDQVPSEAHDEDVDMEMENKRQSIYKGASRPASGISFAGFDSFDEVRRGFEFSGPRPTFYPPPLPTAASAANRSIGTGRRTAPHYRGESVFSIASVSSYGHVINSGSADPFDYGIQMPSLRERPSSEDMSSISMSMTVDDTFAFMEGRMQRRRVESDASTFSFHAPAPVNSSFVRGHRHRESNMSVSSQGPPISLYNRSFGRHHGHHSRNDSSASMSSFSFVRPSNVPGFRRQHARDMSVDSIMSDFSGMHLGRPGVGEKMFDMGNDFLNAPLSAISASPENSFSISVSSKQGLNSHDDADADTSEFNLDSQSQSHIQANRTSFDYDSLIDGTRDASSNSAMPEDSIFDKTGYNPRVSMDGDSVFGHDGYSRRLYAPRQFRPLSMLSVNSVHSPAKEDDTVISMLGGGHVRRCSVGSIVETSPCARVEKRKHSAMLGAHLYKGYPAVEESPAKARIVESPHHQVPRIVEKRSIASTSSFHFGGDRMIDARHGLLERRSLEDSALVAEGEDISGFHSAPVFTRPAPKGRSRSSTCTTSSSSGGDTPPLSASDGDGSSVSGGSQSSIDLSYIDTLLANATHPVGPFTRPHARSRARGAGHRRRFSAARMSRASVYETIEEEFVSSPSSSNRSSMMSDAASSFSARSSLHHDVINETEKWKEGSPTTRLNGSAIYVVESDTASINEESTWDDERGIVTLRKFYALKDEAKETVSESKRTWVDTPFSLFAIQSFQPPNNPSSMQAMLEHSVQNYGPLPSELRPRRIRSRTSSRASPYPQARVTKSKNFEKQATVSPPSAPVPSAPAPTAPLATRPLNILKDRTANPNLPLVTPEDQYRTVKGSKTSINAPSLDALKPFSPLVLDVDTQREKVFGVSARPRVPSTTRRNALGWTKRSNGPANTSKSSNGPKSSTGPKTSTGPGKENVIGTGLAATPGENLRLSRPRPKTRATPAANARTIRI